MVRFYLVPVETVVVGATLWRGPKYLRWRYDPDPPGIPYVARSNRDYGNEPLWLVAADLSEKDDALLSGKPDVFSFPDNLDAPLGNERPKIASELEAFNLPAHWLKVTHTHREVIRGLKGIFDLAQCLQSKGYRVFEAGLTLDSPLHRASDAFVVAVAECMHASGYDRAELGLHSTLRELLAHITHQVAPHTMLGVSL